VSGEPVQQRNPNRARRARGRGHRLRGVLRRSLALCAAVLLVLTLTGLFVASFETLSGSLAHPPGTLYAIENRRPEPAPLAVVLGSNLVSTSELGRRSAARLETAVRLYAEGRVARLHFTGGAHGPVSVAEVMRDYAIARGVPPEAITIETRSLTTLQNALFTLREIGPLPPRTILLTDGMYLPRAWVSYVWAGAGTGLVLVPADPAADPAGEAKLGRYLGHVAREGLAIWGTFGRILVTPLLGRDGIDPDEAPLRERASACWQRPA
jgi:uncharacterized SAM-binding protein YcdF (DUF218 family)